MSATLHYFKWAFVVTVVGLVGAFWLGWRYEDGAGGAMSFLFVGLVLAVLEISLSFDNAIVNANKLKTMDPVWQHRFLTWGIVIAVFGMRIVFPVAVVAIAAQVGPISAVTLAATEPEEYARLMEESHLSIAAFGGSFLLLVGLSFFMDRDKDVDWVVPVERALRRLGSTRGVVYVIAVAVIAAFGLLLDGAERWTFFESAALGVVVFIAVEALNHLLDGQARAVDAARGGLGAFLYLEVLDASFSFDGVIGAFALTQNLFLIAIGLGIGAMYVRSMTIMLVERGTLSQFRYLENGAFWSIVTLALIMFTQSLVHVPEVVTGLLGAGIIAIAFWGSVRFNRRNPVEIAV